MSQKNDISQDNVNIENESLNKEKTTKLVVKKKRFKKSDILVFGVCLTVSLGVWFYASNLQKNAQENELNKEAVKEIVESGMNKNTEPIESVFESLMNSTEAQTSSETAETVETIEETEVSVQ